MKFDFQYIEEDSVGGSYKSPQGYIVGFHFNLATNVLTTDPKICNKKEIKAILARRILENLYLDQLN